MLHHSYRTTWKVSSFLLLLVLQFTAYLSDGQLEGSRARSRTTSTPTPCRGSPAWTGGCTADTCLFCPQGWVNSLATKHLRPGNRSRRTRPGPQWGTSACCQLWAVHEAWLELHEMSGTAEASWSGLALLFTRLYVSSFRVMVRVGWVSSSTVRSVTNMCHTHQRIQVLTLR